jgi:hypothetical protein
MMGMEMMLAKMVGLTPEQMKAMSEQVTTAIFESARLVAEIHAKAADIQERLEKIECQLKAKAGTGQSKRTPAS